MRSLPAGEQVAAAVRRKTGSVRDKKNTSDQLNRQEHRADCPGLKVNCRDGNDVQLKNRADRGIDVKVVW